MPSISSPTRAATARPPSDRAGSAGERAARADSAGRHAARDEAGGGGASPTGTAPAGQITSGVGDAALVRLLAAWTEAPAGRRMPPVVEALGRWLHWTDAIALSEALDGRSGPGGSRAGVSGPHTAADAAAWAAEVARQRTALAAALADDAELRAELARPGATPEADLAACRRHHAERQRALETAVAALRAALRAALTARGGDGARLAAVDQVLAEALGRRERVLLAGVPTLLAPRLRQRPLADGAGPAWVAGLCADLRQVLEAELDLRLQPVLGLLAALRPEPGAGTP